MPQSKKVHTVHIVNGDSAAGSFKQAFNTPDETLLIFRDVLSCGPLKPLGELNSWMLNSWIVTRNNYWAQIGADNGIDSIDDIINAPNDFYRCTEQLKNSKAISLWIGCSLSDHLLLVFIIKIVKQFGLDFSKLSIRQYHRLEKNNEVIIGLGMLSPDKLKLFEPDPIILTKEQIQFCLNTWDALTATTPTTFIELMQNKTNCLPLLYQALENIVYRYPKASNGLSYFDEVILKCAKEHSPQAARVIGHVLAYDMPAAGKFNIHWLDSVGDWFLFSRLKKLAKNNITKPLLSLNSMDNQLKDTCVEITDFGLETLEGKHNAVQINGIDDWVCGVHLDSATNNIWYREGREIVKL